MEDSKKVGAGRGPFGAVAGHKNLNLSLTTDLLVLPLVCRLSAVQ
jgi:hypothetical protein